MIQRKRTSMFLAATGVLLLSCSPEPPPADGDFLATLPPTPAEHAPGDSLYVAHCSSCHGPKGTGTEVGPPLVHVIYEPGHHGDAAFLMAVSRGVVAHHWRFGNMAPLPHVSEPEVDAIVGYVRWLQRQAGIE